MHKQDSSENSASNKKRRKPYGHPENDLVTDSDYTNRPMPGASTIEDLAGQPDPAETLAKNQRSGRQAVIYALGSLVCLFIFAFLLALISRLYGGPHCEAGEAVWICTEFARIWWPILTSLFAAASILGCALIMIRKLNQRLRWWPWMAAFWFLLPLNMLWMTSALPIAIMDGSLLF
ncbi:hypothetical protein [Corynebacterium sp. A21]|uniref:hypothetical protein n=1 Tax=Corynebacterium sp. A21 TaxID=3457318 RepID=UPI003FD64BCE